MRNTQNLLLGAVLICLSAAAQGTPEAASFTSAEPVQRVDSIVKNFRKITVLTTGSERLDRISRERLEALSWTLSQENQGRLADLSETFVGADGHPQPSMVEAFLDNLEQSAYRSGDLLAFEDLFEGLYAERGKLPLEIRTRIEKNVAAIRKIRGYRAMQANRESNRFVGANPSGGEWGSYLVYLNQKYRREQLLKEQASILPSR